MVRKVAKNMKGKYMKEITGEAKIENLDKVQSFIEEQLESIGCSMKTQLQVNVSVEELFVNIARYAYQDKVGEATVKLDYSQGDTILEITFVDEGVQYNPLKKEDPDVTLSAEERQIGGLGIFLVKKNMDDIKYEYKDGKNILSIKKKI